MYICKCSMYTCTTFDNVFHNWLQIDINSDLESQGPFHVFIYKMTDKLAHAENGDQNVWINFFSHLLLLIAF